MQALTDSLKTDRRQVLACIKYEVLSKRRVDEAFKTFCARIGKDVMEYPKFEFWFMKFHNGEVDMDRRKAAKPLELMQLPVDVVAMFVEKLDLPSRLTIRNVCKPLQTVVDNCKIKFKSIEIYECNKGFNLVLGHHRFLYKLNRHKPGTTVVHGNQEYQKKGENKVDLAMTDLKAMMTGHNMQLDRLLITDDIENVHIFEKALKVFQDISAYRKSQYKVKTCYISSAHPELIVPFLTLLEPGILQNVSVNHVSDEISNTEQWRQAKIGRASGGSWVNLKEIQRFRHFEEFQINVSLITAEILVQLKETILTFPSFKQCSINKSNQPPFTINDAATALGQPIQNDEIHVPIPGFDDVLVIEVSAGCINIERRHL